MPGNRAWVQPNLKFSRNTNSIVTVNTNGPKNQNDFGSRL